MICKICKKEFIPEHYNQKYCSPECKYKAKRISQEKYKKTEKGMQSYIRWCKNPIKKKIDKKGMEKPKAKHLAVLRAIKCLHNNPHLQERKIQRDKKYSRTEKGREINRKALRKYRKTEKGKRNAKNYKYNLRNNKSGKIIWEEWEEKLKRLNYQCQVCGSKENITIDHIIPLSKGGTNDIDNLQPLCKSCNSRKSNKL